MRAALSGVLVSFARRSGRSLAEKQVTESEILIFRSKLMAAKKKAAKKLKKSTLKPVKNLNSWIKASF